MNIVIIGGVAAGAKAAAKVKRLLPDSSVKIFTSDTHVSYSSCGLPYYIQGNFTDYRTLLVRSVEEFKQDGIDVFLEHEVTKINPNEHNILVKNKSEAELVSYDRLIIATGARPIVPNIKGNQLKNVFTLRRIEDGIDIRTKMLSSKSAVIVGAGYIGMELLEAFVKNRLKVTVIEKNKFIMPNFDDDISDLIKKRLESYTEGDFEFITGEGVSEILGCGEFATGIKTESGKIIDADFIVMTTGVVPNVEIAQNSGIEIGETGAIKVDKLMRTSIDDIYACGDCAEKMHIVSGKNVWIPLGSTANKEGRCAAINVAGGYSEFEGVLGSAVSRCLNTTMSMTGLSEKEALKLGFSPTSALVLKTDKVAFMPQASDITLKVIADKVTGLLLGAQAIGAVGADKRINALTSALIGHLTVEEYSSNDFTYSPPYSTTIDPLLNAMQILCKRISRHC